MHEKSQPSCDIIPIFGLICSGDTFHPQKAVKKRRAVTRPGPHPVTANLSLAEPMRSMDSCDPWIGGGGEAQVFIICMREGRILQCFYNKYAGIGVSKYGG